jgi:hypothetical protein
VVASGPDASVLRREAQQSIHDPLAEREHQRRVDRDAREVTQQGLDREIVRSGGARDGAEHHPADDVVRGGDGERDLPEVAPHQIEFGQHARDDRQRRQAERGREEEREHGARNTLADQALGDGEPEREARRERQEQAARRDGERRAAETPHELEIGLESGDHEQQPDAHPRDALEQALLDRVGREQPRVGLGPERAEHRARQQQA